MPNWAATLQRDAVFSQCACADERMARRLMNAVVIQRRFVGHVSIDCPHHHASPRQTIPPGTTILGGKCRGNGGNTPGASIAPLSPPAGWNAAEICPAAGANNLKDLYYNCLRAGAAAPW